VGADSSQIRFSIVVPAYNEAAYLGPTLTSLQQQDFRGAYEIIVVDNNSTDETAAIAAHHGVRVLHEPVRGVCAARQRGSEAAIGDIIVSTDADTLYPPDWLRRIEESFGDRPEAVAIAGPCRYSHPTWWMKAAPALLFGAVQAVFALTGAVLYVSATNLAIRRTHFPGYDTTLTQGGDELDLLRRLRHLGRVVWARTNVVTTSTRRFEAGLVYSIVCSLFVHYLLAYALNRLTGRQALGTAPAFRDPAATRPRRRRVLFGVGIAALAVSVGLIAGRHPLGPDGLVSFFTR
jgi:glycosyltransferase involved in cell wall biosynthesis